jgi:YD repeat-containing protein
MLSVALLALTTLFFESVSARTTDVSSAAATPTPTPTPTASAEKTPARATPLASSSDTATYTYDSLNRITKVVYSSGASITYTYDAAGNRTSLQVSGATAILSISSVTPQAGKTVGGQPVKLSGSFGGLSAVMIGGTSASWSYTNGTGEITVTTPAHAVGAVAIDLIPSAGMILSKANAFAYLPTAFTDDTLVARVTTSKGQHVIELRQAVDALRAVAGLGPSPWKDPTLPPFNTIIRADHIQDLRKYLEEAATRLGYPAVTYADPGLGAKAVIRLVHIEELRKRIRDIAH